MSLTSLSWSIIAIVIVSFSLISFVVCDRRVRGAKEVRFTVLVRVVSALALAVRGINNASSHCC